MIRALLDGVDATLDRAVAKLNEATGGPATHVPKGSPTVRGAIHGFTGGPGGNNEAKHNAFTPT